MTARRWRESPRQIGAGVILVVALVMLGVLLAPGSSPRSARPTTPHRRAQDAALAAQLQQQTALAAGLRTQLAGERSQLDQVRAALRTAHTRYLTLARRIARQPHLRRR